MRRIYKAHPNCRWRTSRSCARSSRVYHTSYPVSAVVLYQHYVRTSLFACTAVAIVAKAHRPASLECPDAELVEVGFLQTPPHDDALALLLTLGSANTWYGDLHPISYVPCLAHTPCSRVARLLRHPLQQRCSVVFMTLYAQLR
jgi:hypothetical protein